MENVKSCFSDYKLFLASMVGKEVKNLPRGIHHQSLQKQAAKTSTDKSIASIPAFIMSQYDKTKHPGLRPGLAGKYMYNVTV